MISFLPAGKEHTVNDNGDWKRENRQTARAGKLARKLIQEEYQRSAELKDTDYELFSNLIKADKINDEDCQVKFIEVSGEDIRYRYNEENHSTVYSTGSMGESCMRYEGSQSWLDIYVDNPDKISLLVMIDCDHKTVGRAIVWQTDQGVFMDRVYATDAHQKMFEQYAEDKKWLYKYKHNNDQEEYIMNSGDQEILTLVVKLSNHDYEEYPYMDTLSCLNNSGYISNSTNYNDRELRETGGNLSNQEDDHEGEVYDDYSDRWISEDDSVYIEGYGNTHQDNAVMDEYTDKWMLERDAQKLENGKWCDTNNAVDTEDGWMHEDELDDYEQIDGTWYNRQDSCVEDELTNEYILTDNSVELYSGGRTHEDSRGIVELDESYGSKQYAKKDEVTMCEYSETWWLTVDTEMLYTGVAVANSNMRLFLESHPEEITIANNQLELELHG